MERRRSPRVKCRFVCELSASAKRAEGTVLDLSDGGLSVQTPLELDCGEPVSVRMRPPQEENIEVQAIVWHSRRIRRRGDRRSFSVLGLMLSKAPDAYFSLLPSTPGHEAAPTGTGTPEPANAASREDPPAHEPQLQPFRIRIKHRAGPRTRVLSLSAESVAEARSAALAELNEEWEVMEVWPVSGPSA